MIRSAVDREAAGECGILNPNHAAEIASLLNGTWIDPETGRPGRVGRRTKLQALRVVLDLYGLKARRRVAWP
ncbi:MAG: hypothetical protein IPH13_12165 [Planctomycetes bacterium]|nr:hypothetical protein [Planctomycetota bacterium]